MVFTHAFQIVKNQQNTKKLMFVITNVHTQSSMMKSLKNVKLMKTNVHFINMFHIMKRFVQINVQMNQDLIINLEQYVKNHAHINQLNKLAIFTYVFHNVKHIIIQITIVKTIVTQDIINKILKVVYVHQHANNMLHQKETMNQVTVVQHVHQDYKFKVIHAKYNVMKNT